MIKRFIGWFILIPISVVIIIFALANRHKISLHFDPTSSLNPLIANVEMPLFIIIYAMLFIGIILGGTAVWFTQGKHRKTCRQLNKKITSLEFELNQMKKSAKKDMSENSLLSAQDLLE